MPLAPNSKNPKHLPRRLHLPQKPNKNLFSDLTDRLL
jgi:hypothetical protein